MEVVREIVLRELLRSRAVRSAKAIGRKGGFEIEILIGDSNAPRLLSSTRGDVRVFSNLTTLAQFLLRLGVSSFEVDTTDYQQARIRPARPDRSAALRSTRTKPKQMILLEMTK